MQLNLLVVFADEMGSHSMGCSGDPNVRTPNMGRMAREGSRLTRAYSNTPVCTPARGTLLTGLYPPHHRAMINDIPVRTDVPTLAGSLGAAGYRRGYIGKWHLGGIPRYRFIPPGPERLGFDDFWASWNCHHDYMEPKYFLNDDPEPVFQEGYEPTIQTDLAIGFLSEHQTQHADRPFCLFVSWGPPHDPYEPWPPGLEGSYDPDALTLRPNCEDTPRNRKDLAGHYAHITALDSELGRILDYLEETGLRENTLVVFTSDHGSMLGSQGSYNKQQPWVESVGIPFILWGPDWASTGDNSTLFSLLDFAPTVLGLADVPVPSEMQGVDLAPQVRHREPAEERSILCAEHTCVDQAGRRGIPPWRGVITDRYTYARSPDGPWLLYDDVADPYQLRNRVHDEDMKPVRDRLDSELRAHLARFGDNVMTTGEALDYFGVRADYERRTEFLYKDRNMSGSWPGCGSR